MIQSRTSSIKKLLNISALVLLVLLTVVTSCTARNFLNLSTDIELEKTLNINKTANPQINCAHVLDEVVKTQQATTIFPVFPALFILLNYGFSAFCKQSFQLSYVKSFPDKETPLYILYKKRKILD